MLYIGTSLVLASHVITVYKLSILGTSNGLMPLSLYHIHLYLCSVLSTSGKYSLTLFYPTLS